MLYEEREESSFGVYFCYFLLFSCSRVSSFIGWLTHTHTHTTTSRTHASLVMLTHQNSLVLHQYLVINILDVTQRKVCIQPCASSIPFFSNDSSFSLF